MWDLVGPDNLFIAQGATIDQLAQNLESWKRFAGQLQGALAEAKAANEELSIRRDAFRETAFEIAEEARIPEDRVRELAKKNYEEIRSEKK